MRLTTASIAELINSTINTSSTLPISNALAAPATELSQRDGDQHQRQHALLTEGVFMAKRGPQTGQ